MSARAWRQRRNKPRQLVLTATGFRTLTRVERRNSRRVYGDDEASFERRHEAGQMSWWDAFWMWMKEHPDAVMHFGWEMYGSSEIVDGQL